MTFQLIPVIDLLDGHVVHARRGDRASYAPIESTLCRGSAPLDIVAALLALHAFARLYIADLDAIQRRGDNLAAIAAIRAAHPDIEIWCDAGIADAAALAAWQARDLGRPVVGSEMLSASAFAHGLRRQDEAILSLDFRGDDFAGPADWLADATRWPRQVIAMTLARVGAGLGPDFTRLGEILRRADGQEVFAAGGLRHRDDVRQLARLGAAGVLVASALHDGRLGRAELALLNDA